MYAEAPLTRPVQVARLYRAKATVLFTAADMEFPGEHHCTGCIKPGEKARGPFNTCVASADLFKGSCANVWRCTGLYGGVLT